MDIKMPGEVLFIIRVLNENGYEAYAVGGCVRDSILGKAPKDWDITTNAKPCEVKKLFDRTVDTGIKHGTITVVINRCNYEITTYRTDGEYADNRHPVNIEFASSLQSDLGRRDFTINSIAYHPALGFADPFDGIKDIKNGTIRAVGNAGRRFREDALRMLRAVRFSAQMNFEIDTGTLQSVKDNSSLIINISRERIRDELSGILVSGNPGRFILLKDTGLLQYILPEFETCFCTTQNNRFHIYNVAMHTLNSVSFIENDKTLRWTMLLHDIGKPQTKTTDENGADHFYGHPEKSMRSAAGILRGLRFDNRTIERIGRLIKYHDADIKPEPVSVRKAVAKIGDEIFPDLLKVKEADKKAQNPELLEKGLEKIREIRNIYNNIKEKRQCLSLKDLAINGSDLIGMGFEQDREVGRILDNLLEMVIEDPELNTGEKLCELAGDLRSKS